MRLFDQEASIDGVFARKVTDCDEQRLPVDGKFACKVMDEDEQRSRSAFRALFGNRKRCSILETKHLETGSGCGGTLSYTAYNGDFVGPFWLQFKE